MCVCRNNDITNITLDDDGEEHGHAISPESYNNNNCNSNNSTRNNNNNTNNIHTPDDNEESQAISSQSYSLSYNTTTQATQDSQPPDQRSLLAPGHQQSSTGHQPASKDRKELSRKNRPIYDGLVHFVRGNYENCNSLCMILSGGVMKKITENDPFERDCHNSSLRMYDHFSKQGVGDIVMISPIKIFMKGNFETSLFKKFTMSPFPTFASKDAIDMFEFVKQIHAEKPYSAFFLIIIGHSPGTILRMHNVGEEFYISKYCSIAVPKIKYVTDNLASCELLGIIKDMCNAEPLNLLPDNRPKHAVHVQISSSPRNSKSYSRTPVYDSTLFTSCILSGCYKEQPCPIVLNGITNCKICIEYQDYLTTGGIISYNILFDSYVKPHMLMIPVIGKSHMPVLEFRSDLQEQELIRGIESPNILSPELSNTTQLTQDTLLPDNHQLSRLVTSNQLSNTGHRPAVRPVLQLHQQTYCPLRPLYNNRICDACIKYRNGEISQKVLLKEHMKGTCIKPR